MSQAIEVESDNDIDDVDVVADYQPLSFMKDVIVTPPVVAKTPYKEDVVVTAVKRNLSEVFDGAAKVQGKKSMRRVKIEKE
jgi:hypothetical protein